MISCSDLSEFIQVPENLNEKFTVFRPLFLVDEIPENLTDEYTKRYEELRKTKIAGKKNLKGTKKLLGVILKICTPRFLNESTKILK